MAETRALKGILYNKNKIKNVSRVFCPPYDVISPELQERLYRQHPNNAVRLTLGKQYATDNEQNNRYTRSACCLQDWLKREILKPDRQPAIYPYLREFEFLGEKKSVRGFICIIRLDDGKKRQVMPHENTLAKPKEDRFALLKATRANCGLIYSLCGGGGVIDAIFRQIGFRNGKKTKAPIFRVKDHEGTLHVLWRITDSRFIARVQKAMRKAKIMIADGHHRYETAMNYRDWLRSQESAFSSEHPANFRMMYFADFDDPGLAILPTHRIVHGVTDAAVEKFLFSLEGQFIVERVSGKKKLFSRLPRHKRNEHRFGLYAGGKYHLLELKSEKIITGRGDDRRKRLVSFLDVSILHRFIIEPLLGTKETEGKITYTRDPETAIQAVDRNEDRVAFFLNPSDIDEVKDIAFVGGRMPQKSTYFFPKLLTGLVIYRVE